jgi:hypothetical protein
MWPVEAHNMACETPNFAYFACFFHKKTLFYQLWPLDMTKKKIWPAMTFELCTPDLDYASVLL